LSPHFWGKKCGIFKKISIFFKKSAIFLIFSRKEQKERSKSVRFNIFRKIIIFLKNHTEILQENQNDKL